MNFNFNFIFSEFFSTKNSEKIKRIHKINKKFKKKLDIFLFFWNFVIFLKYGIEI